ncbi:hypothetical protein BH09MYX1_BH09MYX1_46340 [soil metagenome]
MSDEKAVTVHGEALSKGDRGILSEAIQRGEVARKAWEGALVEYGGWLLVNVFHDDAHAALEGREKNRVWRALVERAGGPTLRVSVKLLEVAVRIAAHDKRINDESWRLLEPGRKELLLPLGDEAAMREAAQRVVAMKMSQRATKELVRAQMKAEGRAPSARTTPTKLKKQLSQFNARLVDLSSKRRIESILTKSTIAEKKELRTEVERLAEWARLVLRKLKAK